MGMIWEYYQGKEMLQSLSFRSLALGTRMELVTELASDLSLHLIKGSRQPVPITTPLSSLPDPSFLAKDANRQCLDGYRCVLH